MRVVPHFWLLGPKALGDKCATVHVTFSRGPQHTFPLRGSHITFDELLLVGWLVLGETTRAPKSASKGRRPIQAKLVSFFAVGKGLVAVRLSSNLPLPPGKSRNKRQL